MCNTFDSDDFWHTMAPAIFSEAGWQRAPEQASQILELAQPSPGAKVLDMCCGPGRIALELARRGYDVTGVDRTAEYLEEARDRAAAAKKAPAARKAKFADSKADTLQLNPGELANVRQSMELAKRAHLVVATPRGSKTYPLRSAGTSIGKDAECDIRIYTGWLAPRISAVLTRSMGKGYLLETKGGTITVNGEKCVGTRRLVDEDLIELEGTKLTFHDEMRK